MITQPPPGPAVEGEDVSIMSSGWICKMDVLKMHTLDNNGVLDGSHCDRFGALKKRKDCCRDIGLVMKRMIRKQGLLEGVEGGIYI